MINTDMINTVSNTKNMITERKYDSEKTILADSEDLSLQDSKELDDQQIKNWNNRLEIIV